MYYITMLAVNIANIHMLECFIITIIVIFILSVVMKVSLRRYVCKYVKL